MKKAVILFSGGLDSTTVLYWVKQEGYTPVCLIFDYGQRHRREISGAKKIAQKIGAQYFIVKMNMPWAGSSLLDKSMRIPQGQKIIPGKIPSTYVPARNIVFLSFGASLAEAIGASVVCIGANAIDYSGYPDCRPKFLNAFQKVLIKGLKTGVEGKSIRIKAPLLFKTKTQIVRLAKKLGVPIQLTWSCYEGKRKPCGVCDSCQLRSKGFEEAGFRDPL
jgi:7-cyano-7-deazaguanine synthase